MATCLKMKNNPKMNRTSNSEMNSENKRNHQTNWEYIQIEFVFLTQRKLQKMIDTLKIVREKATMAGKKAKATELNRATYRDHYLHFTREFYFIVLIKWNGRQQEYTNQQQQQDSTWNRHKKKWVKKKKTHSPKSSRIWASCITKNTPTMSLPQ